MRRRLAAMPPKLVNDDGDLMVLRPLAFCAEADLARYRSLFGIDLFWGEWAIPPMWSLLVPTVIALLCLALSIPMVLRACRTDRIARQSNEGNP